MPWNKEGGGGIQNENVPKVETRRKWEHAAHPSGLTLYKKRDIADDDFHPEERRKYQLVDDHWPKPKEEVKVISDRPRDDGYIPHKPLKKLKPFPDPMQLQIDSVNYHGDAPYLHTVAANSMIGATKYYGFNNRRYFRSKGYNPEDHWGQLGMPPRYRVWTNAQDA